MSAIWSDQPAAHAAAQERAKRRKLAAQDDPQAKERREAAAVLRDATLGKDEDALYDALEKAPKREKDRAEAEVALEVALSGNDVAAMGAAIARAEELGIAAQNIERARFRKVALEKSKLANEERQSQQLALQALKAAAGSTDLKEISNALTRAAFLGIPRHHMEATLRRKAQLESNQHGRIRSDALQGLHGAVKGTDIAELAAAIDKAAAAGIDPQEMVVARTRLKELRQARTSSSASGSVTARPTVSAEARRMEASRELTSAVAGADLQVLLQAIQSAMAAGVDSTELWHAQQRRTVLEAQLRERLLQTFAPGV